MYQARKLDTIGFLKADYLTASLRALPALNAGTLEAAIVISLPVCGLRPLRAARSRTGKEIKIAASKVPAFKAGKALKDAVK